MIGHRQLTMEDYFAILRRHRMALISFVVLCPIAGYLLCYFLPKQYTSQTTILVQQPAIPDTALTDISTGDLKQKVSSLQEQILSRSNLEGVIEKFGLYPKDRQTVPMEILVDRLRRKIKVQPVKPMAETNSTQLPGFIISVTNRDAALAQKICSDITERFMVENRSIRHEQAQQTTVFLTQQINDAKAKLDEQDGKLAAFKQRYLGELPDDQQANLSILSTLNSQLDAVNQELGRAQQDKTFAQSMLADQIASHSGNSAQSLQKQLSDDRAQLAQLQTKYTTDHPDIIRLKADIADLEAKIAASDKNTTAAETENAAVPLSPEIDQLRAQVHQYDSVIKEKSAQQRELQRKIAAYQGRVQLSPNVEEQYKLLTRDTQAAQEFYNKLLKQRSESAMESEINHRTDTDEFRVLDAANVPVSPSFPNRLYFSLGGLGVGLFLALGVVLLGEVRDKTLRTEQDVEFFLQVPTLVNIPSIGTAQRLAAKERKGDGPRLVANA